MVFGFYRHSRGKWEHRKNNKIGKTFLPFTVWYYCRHKTENVCYKRPSLLIGSIASLNQTLRLFMICPRNALTQYYDVHTK